MGADKAQQTVAGTPMAVLAGRALLAAATPVFAVGPDPGLGLPEISDDGVGPLGALLSGLRHLAGEGLSRPVLVVACDLPFVTTGLLEVVSSGLGDADAAVPVSGGRLQPLAACYSPRILPVAAELAAAGHRSMKALLEVIDVRPITESEWRSTAPPHALTDVDTPEELDAANRKAVVAR